MRTSEGDRSLVCSGNHPGTGDCESSSAKCMLAVEAAMAFYEHERI